MAENTFKDSFPNSAHHSFSVVMGSSTVGTLVTASPWCPIVLRDEGMAGNRVPAVIVLPTAKGGESALL